MNQNYLNLEQRMIAFFYQTMPKFVPTNTPLCTEEEQANLYQFIYKTYEMIYNDPTLLYPTLNKDDAFNSVFTSVGHPNPNLAPLMKKQIKVIEDYLQLLIKIGKEGKETNNKEILEIEIKTNRRYQNLLCLNGLQIENNLIINEGKPFFNALRWFSQIDNLNIRRFATCSFNDDYNYVNDIMVPLLDKEPGATMKLINWLTLNNYIPHQYLMNQYKVDYVKSIDNAPHPIGLAMMGDHFHLGFTMEYRYPAIIPYYCSIRTLNYKAILQDFNNMSDTIQAFIITMNKRCDNCRYCIQMDKTKTKPKAFVMIDYQDKKYPLCPLYQGFNYSFRDLTFAKVDQIIEMLELLEKYNLKK